MKNTKFQIILIAVITSILYSCSNDITEDNTANFQAKSIEKDLAYFTKIQHEEQRTEFLSLDLEDRVSIWNEKLDILIASIDNADERDVVNQIASSINQELVSQSMTQNIFEHELEGKLNTLVNEYGWSDDAIFVTFASLYPVKQISNQQKNSFQSPSFEFSIVDAGFELDCNCRWGGIGCGRNICYKKKGCPSEPEDEMGCGFLLLQSSDSQCG